MKISSFSYFSFVILILFTLLFSGCKKEEPENVTFCGSSTLKDIDGNQYDVVQIGQQCWMAENLKTTRYKDGSTIQGNLNDSVWAIFTSGAYAIYGEDPVNESIYGKLYNWYAIETGKLCPEGWKIPSTDDWDALYLAVYGNGGSLKSLDYWDAPNIGATDSTGFNGRPGGERSSWNVKYENIGLEGNWWVAYPDPENQVGMTLKNNDSEIWWSFSSGSSKNIGKSCRCIKN